MSVSYDGNYQGPRSAGNEQAGRFLEDTGSLITGPHGPVARVGPHRSQPERLDLDGVDWYLIHAQWLEWQPVFARAILEGSLITNILPPGYILLGGTHRPVWHPKPGVDDADLAFFPEPIATMDSVQLMVRLAQFIGRT